MCHDLMKYLASVSTEKKYSLSKKVVYSKNIVESRLYQLLHQLINQINYICNK